jgi:uncharacterized protein (TIGR03437 family)
MVSGNGQMVGTQSLTHQPLVVQANDANGNPVPGVAITWTQVGGTLPDATPFTDANGQASTDFTSSSLQPEASFLNTVVTASSPLYGSVSFNVITVPTSSQQGGILTLPTIKLVKPAVTGTLMGSQGSTLPGAVQVRVTAGSGAEVNAPIPNVSVQIVNALNAATPPGAHCNGPGGIVYTDSTGTASCDLVITGQPGETPLAANVGDFQPTGFFELQINAGAACTYSLSPTSQAISASGGAGSVNVIASSTCGWAATSNVNWIVITSAASGTGNGTVSYTAGADAAGARSGTMTIAGQTFTVNEGAGVGGVLTITTPANLPGGAVNQSYSATLGVSGGNPAYTWAITSGALPAGLVLNASSGLISGAATAVGTTSFTATVTDSNGNVASMVFSLTITATSSTFVITNPSFPNGVISVAYSQALTSAGGEVTPFFEPVFAVTGGALPPGLNITKNSDLSSFITGTPTTAGVSSFTLTATDAAQNTTSANFTITITGPPIAEQMAASPTALSFTVDLGSPTIPAAQALSITGNSGQLNYTSVLTTASGGSWLVAQGPTSGNTVGTINIGVANYSTLAPGPYMGTVTISSQASNSPLKVPVTLTVVAAPTLSVSPAQLTVSQGQSTGPNVSNQSLQVLATSQTASGTNTLGFAAAATTKTGGNWLSVSPSTGATPDTLTVSIDSGGLALGAYTGTITVSPASGAPEIVSVTLNVINPQALSAAPSPVAITYTFGAPAPAAQSVTVSSTAGPALSLSTAVATKNNTDWLFVNPTSGTTPLALSVSVNPNGLAPATYTGTITVTASDVSVTPLAIPVTLTVTPAVPTIDGVSNAASFAPGPVAPGEIVTIFGSVLGPATGVAADSAGKIGTSLGGTEVFFNSFRAPILYSSAGQVSVIVPYELAGASSTSVQVEYQSIESTSVDVRVIDSAPGIFTVNLAGQGAIINQNGTINSTTDGAPIGSTVSIYATGEGQTSPAGVDGAINGGSLPLPVPVTSPVTVQIGGLPATVTYAGGAPNEVEGLLQVNATIPAGVPKGSSVAVVLTVGTSSSQTGVTIFIHP